MDSPSLSPDEKSLRVVALAEERRRIGRKKTFWLVGLCVALLGALTGIGGMYVSQQLMMRELMEAMDAVETSGGPVIRQGARLSTQVGVASVGLVLVAVIFVLVAVVRLVMLPGRRKMEAMEGAVFR